MRVHGGEVVPGLRLKLRVTVVGAGVELVFVVVDRYVAATTRFVLSLVQQQMRVLLLVSSSRPDPYPTQR